MGVLQFRRKKNIGRKKGLFNNRSHSDGVFWVGGFQDLRNLSKFVQSLNGDEECLEKDGLQGTSCRYTECKRGVFNGG